MENVEQILVDVRNVSSDGSAYDLVSQLRLVVEALDDKSNDDIFRIYDALIQRLRDVKRNTEAGKERVAVLDLFVILVSKFPSGSYSNCVSLKEIAFDIFRMSRVANERNAALSLIFTVLKISQGSQMIVDLDVNGLTQRLFQEIAQNPTATVLQNVLSILGLISLLYPEYFDTYAQRLNEITLKTLRKEMTSKSKAPQLAAIAGCIYCLKQLYVNFPPSGDKGPEIHAELFRFIKKLINPAAGMKRYDAVRKSMEFFIQHAALMRDMIYQDCKELFEYVRAWCLNSKDTETKYKSMEATEILFEQISLALTENPSTDIFKYFVVQLRKMLEQNTSLDEVTIAIHGLGSFAKLCRAHLTGNEVRQLFDLVSRHLEKIYFSATDQSSRRFYKLPSHLQSVSAIVREMEEMSDMFLNCLVKLVVEMVRAFPRISSKSVFPCVKAIYSVMKSLEDKPAAFSMFLEEIVFQCLTHTCSHTPPAMETDGTKGEDDEEVSYKLFLPLWNMLLKMDKYPSISSDGVDERQKFSSLFYRQFIVGHLHMIERLDLTLKSRKSDDAEDPTNSTTGGKSEVENASDPTAGLVPANVHDVTIFVNMVDCVIDILGNCEPHRICQWFPLYRTSLLRWLHENPLLSGFYKLLGNALHLADKAGYFSDKEHQEEELPVFQALAIRVLAAMKQYRDDDLRVACLQLILSLPVDAVRDLSGALIPALQAAAELSLSHLPMMKTLLDALESWVKQMRPDVADLHLRPVLPLLEPLLHSQDRTQINLDNEKKIDGSRRIRALARSIRMVNRQKAVAAATGNISVENKNLVEVQMNLMKFLGRLGGHYSHHFIRDIIENVEADQLSLVRWDPETRLTFTLPFRDLKVDINLDVFLPLIVSLATGSGDRQSRVSACELLHATVIFMVGKSEPQTSRSSRGAENKAMMAGLWKHLFKVLLILACDLDDTIRQLMQPLVMQIIHWYTRPLTFRLRDTEIILDTIFETLASSNHEASRRDFAAQALQEFVIWSIKHSPKDSVGQSDSQVNVDSIIEKLARLAIHPSSHKRLGAAVGFNAVYRHFREEKRLVNAFAFLLLDNFIHSMALAELDHDGKGILAQTEKSIDHLQKIIVKMSSMLSEPDETRRCPRRWERSCTLDIAVRATLRHCSRPETRCRRQCMKLLCALADKIPGIHSVAMFFTNRLQEKGPMYIVERFESESLARKDCPSINAWLSRLCGVQDCYVWSISQKFLPAKILLSASNSRFLPNLIEFYSWVQKEAIETSLIAWLIVSTMNVIVCLCNNHKMIESDIAWKSFVGNSDLIKTLTTTFLMPRSLGFTLSDIEVISQLPEECGQFLQWFKFAPERARQLLRQNINTELHRRFGESFEMLFNRSISATSGEEDDFLFLMESLLRLRETNWIDRSIKLVDGSSKNVLNSIVKSSVQSNEQSVLPKERKVQTKTMIFLLQWTLDVEWLVNTLCSSDGGDRFYSIFHNALNEFIISHTSSAIITKLMSRAGTHPSIVATIIEQLLETLKKQKRLRDKFSNDTVSAIVTSWSCLEPWWRGDDSERKLIIIGFITKLLLLQPKVASEKEISNSYLHILRDVSISSKTRVLDLLGYFMLNDDLLENISNALNEFACHLPPRSSDLVPGSTNACEYNEVITRLFTALEVSGNVKLFQVLIGIFCREDEHAADEDFFKLMSQLGESLSLEKQRSFLDLAFSFLYNEGLSSVYRRLCVKKVLLPLLQAVNLDICEAFVASNIVKFMTDAEMKLPSLPTGNAEPEEGPTISLIRKSAALQVLEETYLRLAKKRVHSSDCLIVQSICKAENKDASDKYMTIRLIKACESVLSEDHSNGPPVVRRMLCSAYNCFIAVISKTQQESRYYSGLILHSKETNKPFLENVVGSQMDMFIFPQEVEAPLRKKAQFEAASKQRSAGSSSEDNEGDYEEDNQVAYISTQYLTQSSLSTELSQYDRLANTQILLSQAAGEGNRPILRRVRSSRRDLEDLEVILEEDCANSHPCMIALVRLIRHMERIGILRDMGEEAAPDLHMCLKFFHNKLSNNTTHPNVKIFIAKLIVNCQKTFRPYAAFFLMPLCRLIVSERNGGNGIHTLIVDIMYVLLSWEKIAIPQDTFDDCALACRVVEFIMEHCHHENRSILRNNLSMLKLTLECWKSRIRIDTLVLSRHMKMVDLKNPRSALGIQMLAAVMANGLPYYTPSSAIDRTTFQYMLSENISHNYKEVYAAASEVCGMLLSRMSQDGDPDLTPFQDRVANVISSHQTRNRLAPFVLCLALACKHHLPLADRFLSKLMFELPRMQEDSLAHAIDILARRAFDVEATKDRIFVELKEKGFFDLLSQKKSRILLPALRLCSRVLANPVTTENQRAVVLAAILPCTHSAHVEVRRVLYEVLVEHYRETDCRPALLEAMADSDEATRLFVHNFWSSSERLSGATWDRCVAIFQNMFSPVAESAYLSYSNSLILELTSRSTDFKRRIFPDLEPGCKFESFHPGGLNNYGKTKEKGSSLMPLFISGISQEEGEKAQEEVKESAVIRATLEEPQFTQTQADGESRRTFNWLTQDSMAMDSMAITSGETVQSALLVGGGPSRRTPLSRNRAKSTEEEQLSERELDLRRLRRRFTRGTVSEQVRERVVRRQKKQEKRKIEGPRSTVTLYRSYRKGELPDIQIDYASVIAPLQALALCDSRMSNMLLSEVVRAIWKEEQLSLDDDDEQAAGNLLRIGLEHVLKQTRDYSPPVVGCALQIGLELRRRGHQLDPSLVSTAAIEAGHQALAKLLLEEDLSQNNDSEDTTFKVPKRPRLSIPIPACIELARLYKSDGDLDNLIGLLEAIDIDSYSDYKLSLQHEAQGDFTSAGDRYLQSLEKCDNSDDFVFLAEDGILHCFNSLSKWESLDDHANELGATFELRVWEDLKLQDLVLPLRLRASTKRLQYDDIYGNDLECHEPLVEFFNISLDNLDYKSLCENKFCEELAILSIIQDEYDKARLYCNKGFQKIVSEIGYCNEFQSTRKRSCIQRLQILSEMKEFLALFKNQSHVPITGSMLDNLFQKWTERQPHPLLTPCTVWEDIVTNRFMYYKKLCAAIADMDDDSQNLTLDTYRLKWRLGQVDAANQQRNSRLALACLKEARFVLKNVQSSVMDFAQDLTSDFYSAFVETWQCEVTRQLSLQHDTDALINRLLGLTGKLDKVQSKPSRYHSLLAENAILIGECLRAGDQASASREKVMEFLKCDNPDNVNDALCKCVVDNLRASIKNGLESSSLSYKDSRISLASYCDRYLRQHEETSEDETMSETLKYKEFPTIFVQSILEAMKDESIEARLRFPRALQIAEYYPESQKSFIEQAATIPCWMFLMWIPQMLASLDKPESRVVQNILLRIGETYPNAIVYPFKVKQESFEFDDEEEVGLEAKSVADKLEDFLSKMPQVERFLSGLDQLSHPSALFQDWSAELSQYMSRTPSQRKKKQILDKFKQVYDMLFEEKEGQTEVSLYGETLEDKGEFRRSFAKRFIGPFQTRFGKDGKKLLEMKPSEYKNAVNYLKNAMKEMKDTPTILEKYSLWLSQYDGLKSTLELEVPGQYQGWTMPQPELHAKIVRFLPNVDTLESMRKPKKIMLLGSDQKQYSFLVKGGEDLRQDQRLEQAFDIVNRLFTWDPNTSQRNLRLRTYNVIPLTTRVGILEWVDNSIPYGGIYKANINKMEINATEKTWKKHAILFGCDLPNAITAKHYTESYQSIPKKRMTAHFKALQESSPSNILRRNFMKMSSSPEAFYTLRSSFQRTYGTMCAVHYLFGIGDRHSGNIMICQRTGEAIGIDFGYAFGLHLQLSIPELTPFRLTYPIQTLMEPAGFRGQYAQCMVASLSALRNRKELMMTLMQVFVKDKSVDWMRCADMARRDNREAVSVLETDESWFPKQRISLVRRKFEGEHPSRILRDELRLFKGRQPWCEAVCRVIMGEKNVDKRAALPDDRPLTPQEQAEVLIDIAIDPNVLARQYWGWNALM